MPDLWPRRPVLSAFHVTVVTCRQHRNLPPAHNPEAPMDDPSGDSLYGQVPRHMPRREPFGKPNFIGAFLVVAVIVALIGFAVYSCAKAEDDPYHVITLFIAVITGPGKQDIRHQEPMPDIQTCLAEAGKFLSHKFPDTVDAKRLVAGCSVPQDEENPS